MRNLTLPSERTVWLLFIAASLLIGWSVPQFYDWTGSDQSRMAPMVAWTGLGLVAGALAVCLLLPWFPMKSKGFDSGPPARARFTLRTLLILTSVAAILCLALLMYPMIVSGGLCAVAFCFAVWFGIGERRYALSVAALIACILLPFIWLLTYGESGNISSDLLRLAPGLPGLFPALLASAALDRSTHDLEWLPLLLTAIELAVGMCVMRLGPKPTIAYLMVSLLISTFGSFCLHALLRA